MARKPLSEKTVAENCLKWGTGGINIDESRVGTEQTITRGRSSGGTYDIGLNNPEFTQTNTGRFPANLIHDNSEEVRECFPNNVKGEIGRAGRKSGGNYDASSYKVGVVTDTGFKDNGNASRFFKSIIYQAKASKSDRGQGNNHPTVKPIALMEYLIKMVTKPGGVVLDESRVEMSQDDKEMLDAKASISNNGVNFDVGEGKAKERNLSDQNN